MAGSVAAALMGASPERVLLACDNHLYNTPTRPSQRSLQEARATVLSELLRELGIPAVPHGFRSSFRDWAAEETDHPREVVEAALAHVVRNTVEAEYRRTDLFERRRRLMEDWAAALKRSQAR